MRVIGSKRQERAVFPVGGVIKLRHIEAFDLSSSFQEFLPAFPGSFPLFISIQQLVINSLSLSDIEEIKELRKGLRIIGARPAADHNGIRIRPFCCAERDMAQFQDLKDVCIAHLKLDRNAEEVEILYRILRLQGKKGDLLLPHHLVQIDPRGINPLTPDVIPAVEHIVQDLDAQVGHADLIYIREAHGKADIHLVFVLHHRIHFAADIARRLFNIQQYFIA